jgi:predicted metallopeptidase
MTKFFNAPEVEEIAQELITKYHHHITDYSVKIRYIFVEKAPSSKGKEVWGTCRKISGLNAYLEGENPDGDPFFVITISKDIWDILPKDKKIALVDHELCHTWAEVKQQKDESEDDSDMEVDNPVKLSVKSHDLEEFSCIVRRHGLWREDVKDFVEVALKVKKEQEEKEKEKEKEEI